MTEGEGKICDQDMIRYVMEGDRIYGIHKLSAKLWLRAWSMLAINHAMDKMEVKMIRELKHAAFMPTLEPG